MPTQTLVDREIDEGRILIDAIRKAGLRVKSALWFYAVENEEWRLMIQFSGLSDDFNHHEVYKRLELIRRDLGDNFTLRLRRVVIQSQYSPIANTVRHKLAKIPAPKQGLHYIGERIGVDFIEDVYVYFI